MYLFFTVGALQQRTEVFAEVTPLITSIVLIATCVFACALHLSTTPHKKAALFWFSTAGITGMLVEILGVNTGFPFGSYQYSERLLPRLGGVPIVIGAAWILVCVLGADLASRVASTRALYPVIGAAAVTLLDITMEPAAVEMQLWSWTDGVIPLSNYVAWFVTSYLIIALGSALKVIDSTPSFLLGHLYVGQLFFFIAVGSLW
jgi:putative membrane protein